MTPSRTIARSGFSLVEVVLAVGIAAFAVLTTIGLMSVGGDAQRRSRDEGLSSRLVANEFERLRSLDKGNFPTSTYNPRYFDSNLVETNSSDPKALYKLSVTITAAPTNTADLVFNADVRYPARAPTANQNVYHYTTLMNIPSN